MGHTEGAGWGHGFGAYALLRHTPGVPHTEILLDNLQGGHDRGGARERGQKAPDQPSPYVHLLSAEKKGFWDLTLT